jgi:DNA-binding NarL/FixJ family response regulator
MVLSHEPVSARVAVVGKDPVVRRTLTRLLELDEEIEIVGEAPSIGTAALAEEQPDLILLDPADQTVDTAQAEQYVAQVAPGTKICLLDSLRDLTLGEILKIVKSMAPPQTLSRPRHLHPVASPAESEALSALSARELEVVRLVAEGLSNKEISVRLSLSDKTVKNHISHILAKMNLTARTQVAVYAIRAGLV